MSSYYCTMYMDTILTGKFAGVKRCWRGHTIKSCNSVVGWWANCTRSTWITGFYSLGSTNTNCLFYAKQRWWKLKLLNSLCVAARNATKYLTYLFVHSVSSDFLSLFFTWPNDYPNLLNLLIYWIYYVLRQVFL